MGRLLAPSRGASTLAAEAAFTRCGGTSVLAASFAIGCGSEVGGSVLSYYSSQMRLRSRWETSCEDYQGGR